jgi:hypothetical protein
MQSKEGAGPATHRYRAASGAREKAAHLAATNLISSRSSSGLHAPLASFGSSPRLDCRSALVRSEAFSKEIHNEIFANRWALCRFSRECGISPSCAQEETSTRSTYPIGNAKPDGTRDLNPIANISGLWQSQSGARYSCSQNGRGFSCIACRTGPRSRKRYFGASIK